MIFIIKKMDTIKGTKVKMSQIFKADECIPVSLVKVEKEAIENFKEGELLNVTGVTKGKGFQGVVKRYSFAGGPQTHGQKNRLRAPGSIGSTAPQRIPPGRKMAGRMGGANKTIRNLEVVQIDKENNILMLRGSVPGNNRGKVKIKKSIYK